LINTNTNAFEDFKTQVQYWRTHLLLKE
jgi:hypothetical protein